MINLDYAATTPVHQDVLDAMLPYFCENYANASSMYTDARTIRKAIDASRKTIAQEIHAQSSEIYFTSGGTESDNWAILGSAFSRPEKRHIITSQVEHHAVLNSCKALEDLGWEITYVPVDNQCRVSAKDIMMAIRPDTALISVMLANNEVGTIEPIEEIATLAHSNGILMHTDAVQAVGHIPVDVKQLDVDMLSISAHKFGGPKGIGALYIRSGIALKNLIYGGAQERGLRGGTENTPAIVGFAKALSLSSIRMKENRDAIESMRNRLGAELSGLPGIRLNASETLRLPSHLHISVDGFSSQMLLMKLDMMGIAASAGSACASGAAERSHVVLAMGIAGENQADIRFTIGENTTIQEIDRAAAVLKSILCK